MDDLFQNIKAIHACSLFCLPDFQSVGSLSVCSVPRLESVSSYDGLDMAIAFSNGCFCVFFPSDFENTDEAVRCAVSERTAQ
jgi:hypothetical protein